MEYGYNQPLRTRVRYNPPPGIDGPWMAYGEGVVVFFWDELNALRYAFDNKMAGVTQVQVGEELRVKLDMPEAKIPGQI